MPYCPECNYEISGGERECPDCGDPLAEVATEAEEHVEVIRDDEDRIKVIPLDRQGTDEGVEEPWNVSVFGKGWGRVLSAALIALGVAFTAVFLSLGLWLTVPDIPVTGVFVLVILIVSAFIVALLSSLFYSKRRKVRLGRVGFYVSSGMLFSLFYLYSAAHWIGPTVRDMLGDSPDGGDDVEEEIEDGDPEQDEAGDMDWDEATGQAQDDLEATMENLDEMTSGGGGESWGIVQVIADPIFAFLFAIALTALAITLYFREFREAPEDKE